MTTTPDQKGMQGDIHDIPMPMSRILGTPRLELRPVGIHDIEVWKDYVRMKVMKTIMMAIGLAVVLSLCISGAGRLAYSRGWMDIDVSDEHGHGPDRGPEWDRAARFHITRVAVLSGVVSLPLAFLGLMMTRKLKCEQSNPCDRKWRAIFNA